MISGNALQRAEIRRLVSLFDENLYGDVTAPALHEKMKKRLVLRQSPDGRVLREMGKLLHGHLDYIDWLVDTRQWLAGPTLSLADLACAAQLSVVDYLGAIDWKGHEQAPAGLAPPAPQHARLRMKTVAVPKQGLFAVERNRHAVG